MLEQFFGLLQATADFNGTGKQDFFGLGGYHLYFSRNYWRRAFGARIIHTARPFIIRLITAYADGLRMVRAWLIIKKAEPRPI